MGLAVDNSKKVVNDYLRRLQREPDKDSMTLWAELHTQKKSCSEEFVGLKPSDAIKSLVRNIGLDVDQEIAAQVSAANITVQASHVIKRSHVAWQLWVSRPRLLAIKPPGKTSMHRQPQHELLHSSLPSIEVDKMSGTSLHAQE